MKNNFVTNVIIEIPKHSNIKYEWDRKQGRIIVDRILYGANFYPQNYGFIENTLDWDGDELDALVIADQSFVVGSQISVKIIGALKMIDNGETDTKLITVIDCDPRWDNINSLSELNQNLLLEIENFFNTYKILQNKPVKTNGFVGKNEAIKFIEECRINYKKYHQLDKEDFISKMKSKHPEKY